MLEARGRVYRPFLIVSGQYLWPPYPTSRLNLHREGRVHTFLAFRPSLTRSWGSSFLLFFSIGCGGDTHVSRRHNLFNFPPITSLYIFVELLGQYRRHYVGCVEAVS